ncbi:hypothetical protein N431DRAFT_543935 [Stipitochalara longipes BDJ]|nr:hypothetical protein N431DRAFT_543935 [Stipitochalara longipes BDJ]
MDFISGPTPSMSDEAATTISGKRRLRRSCESCRNSKGKCVPSEQTGQCQRCVKEGQQCTFLEAKPRPKRAKNSRTRVAEMEEKLDGLMALLASRQTGKEASPSESSSTPSHPPIAVSPPELELQAFTHPISSSVSSVSFSRSDDFRSQQSQPVFAFPNFDQFNDVISRGIISTNQAEKSIRYFQSKASQFPFVLVPPKMGLEALRRERPFFLLSILSFAAHHNEKLQLRLELELRESLSKRVIVHCEKSLDLLQGVLVYLAWYHFYFEPDREQLYQLSQMAAAMAIDLGINKPTSDSASNDVRALKAKLFLPNLDDFEAQRTFLACYFLTSTICQGLRKPNSLKYCDYMETCAESLARAASAENDYLLQYHIRFQRLSEEIDHAFDYSQNLKLPQLDVTRIEILLKSFEQQLNQFELTFPAHVWNNPSMTMKFYHLRIYINEIGLHAVKPSDLSTMSTSWYYSTTRNEILLRCLQNIKDYMDRYLLLTTANLAALTLTDYISLVYAVLGLGAFATGANDTQITSNENMKASANLDYYLDALSAQALQLLAVSEPGSNNFVSHIYDLFQQSKIWYSQLLQDPTPIERGAGPNLSFMEIIPTIMARCVDFSVKFASAESDGGASAVGEGMEVVGGDEQWSEMLSSWAASQDLSNMVLDTPLV